jgi:hypothetical protein
VRSATTLRIRDGETLLTDGPYAELKEQLGGYYLLECADLDEALRWARTIPAARYGTVEVRPLLPVGGRGCRPPAARPLVAAPGGARRPPGAPWPAPDAHDAYQQALASGPPPTERTFILRRLREAAKLAGLPDP